MGGRGGRREGGKERGRDRGGRIKGDGAHSGVSVSSPESCSDVKVTFEEAIMSGTLVSYMTTEKPGLPLELQRHTSSSPPSLPPSLPPLFTTGAD